MRNQALRKKFIPDDMFKMRYERIQPSDLDVSGTGTEETSTQVRVLYARKPDLPPP